MQTAKLTVRGIDWVKLGITAIYGFCIGFFLMARFQAFLSQTWGVGFNNIFVWIAAFVLFVVLLVLFPLLNKLLTGTAVRILPAAIITVLSLAFCFLLQRIIIDRVIFEAELGMLLVSRTIMIIGAGLLLSLFLIILYHSLAEVGAGIVGWIKSLTLKDLLFALGSLIILNVLTVIYMKNSSTIYFWDNAGYWEHAQNLTEYSKNGISAMLSSVYESVLVSDYNKLIALPFVPIFKIFGSSRLVFVLTVVNLYLFPLLLLIYGIALSVTRRALAASVCAICTVPMLFYLSVLGFVDVAGVFFALASAFLCLSSVNSEKPSFGRYFITGCFLAASVLLRRWYVFFALSLLLSQLISGGIFKKSVAPFLWSAGSFAFMLLFLFQPMVSRILLADYASAYSSYSMNIQTDFMLLFRYFGIFTLSLSLIAFFLCIRKKQLRHNAVLVLLQAVSCFVLFTFIQTHGQQHLLLYVPAVILALIAFYSMFLEYAFRHKLAFAAISLSALLPVLSPFLPREQPESISEIKSIAVFPSFTYDPPKRDDALEIVRLVRYLDEAAGEDEKTVGVLASSFILNDDILRKAEASLSLPRVSDVPRTYILTLPAVDSRDSFPGALFDCDFLLVATPIQLHLGEENQNVVAIPAGEVLDSSGFGAAYHPMGEVFFIGDGSVSVQLYEKIRAVTEDEMAALVSVVEKEVGTN